MAAANVDHLSESSLGRFHFIYRHPCLLEELVAVAGYFSKRIEIDKSVIQLIKFESGEQNTINNVFSSTKR